ncbi:MAG: PQQ-like beta-propeller repeat protein [Candidatus Lokiarchaeota archaeon]|nr:PQQ-like beta-propeller repeat protein [Candidatus Lokiarchaeota archaeon]
MPTFVLSEVAGPKGEVDSFDCYSLPGDLPGEFHVACTTSTMELVGITARVCGGGIEMEERWRRGVGSRSWHVVAHVLDPASEPAVFTAREDGHFHAYKVDGTPCWSHDFAATVSEFKLYVEPFSGERMLLVPSLDKTLRLLTASAGRLVWGDTFQSGVNAADQCLLEDGETHVIVAGGNDHTLRCYKRGRGDKPGAYKMAWFHKFGSYVRDASASPVGLVAAVSDDGFLKVLEARDGSASWQHEHNSFAWKCRILPDAGRVVSTSFQLPIAVDESGQKLGNPGVVACHDLETGELIWSTRPEDGVNVSAWSLFEAVKRPNLLVGTTGGDVLLMDVATGGVAQRLRVPHSVNRIAAIPLPGGRTAVVGCQESEDGSLFAAVAQE